MRSPTEFTCGLWRDLRRLIILRSLDNETVDVSRMFARAVECSRLYLETSKVVVVLEAGLARLIRRMPVGNGNIAPNSRSQSASSWVSVRWTSFIRRELITTHLARGKATTQREFNGHELITDVLDGATFKDGTRINQHDTTTATERVAS